MPEETKRPWGEYEVLSKTKIVVIKPDKKLSLQYHNERDEYRRIVQGKGWVKIGDLKKDVSSGEEFNIPRKTVHRIGAYSEGLIFVEVATGNVNEDDIVRLEDDYNRIKNGKNK